MIILQEIWVYPVKSLRGIALQEATLSDRGFEHDRRWMLVDTQGRFVSQREYPKMSLVETKVLGDQLIVSHLSMPDLSISLKASPLAQKQVLIWDDTCLAETVSDSADYWFSEFLEMPCQLVYMPEQSERKIEKEYDAQDRNTSFSDGYPYLLISEESLEDLNTRLEKAVGMNRFRPNLVVKGASAYEEDQWKVIRIGDVFFDVAKPCGRCVMTTINPLTAEKGREPLYTLSTYRRMENKILFGQNLIQRFSESNKNSVSLRTGLEIEVIEKREPLF